MCRVCLWWMQWNDEVTYQSIHCEEHLLYFTLYCSQHFFVIFVFFEIFLKKSEAQDAGEK